MRILLSAYACEPNRGSEPGVGWHWALELAKMGHKVWVLTRANNRPVIKAEFQKTPRPNNLNFIYYDLPHWSRWWKRGRQGVHLYYLLWQWGAYKKAKKINEKEKFDLVHHITFGVIRQPSFMGLLQVPFIFGPVGGGERAPYCLRKSYPLKGKILDFTRDILNILVRFDPLIRLVFNTATVIYTKTPESTKILPLRYHKKVKTQIEIGVDLPCGPFIQKGNGPLRILFIGRFVYWKGMHFGIMAFANIVEKLHNTQLTIVGVGAEKKSWQRFSTKYDVFDNITWIDWIDQNELMAIYRNHDVFLFPSLHDSSGNVLLEAMAYGLPVICLDIGGPGVIVDDSCGVKIPVEGKNETEVVEMLGEALITISRDPIMRQKLSEGACDRARQYLWKNVVQGIYSPSLVASNNCSAGCQYRCNLNHSPCRIP